MTVFTLRLNINLNEKLDYISKISGTSKAYLIVYALNEALRTKMNLQDYHVVTEESVRMTIRLTSELNNLITTYSEQNNLTKNSIVNSVVNKYLNEVWTYY